MDGWPGQHARTGAAAAAIALFLSPLSTLPSCSAAEKGEGNMECRPLHGILNFSGGIYKSERTNIKVRGGGSGRLARLLAEEHGYCSTF